MYDNFGTAITSGSLYWEGANLLLFNGGDRAQMFAPASYVSGSSVSHFDEDGYDGTFNSVMTPNQGLQEANHNIGQLTRGLFKDLGYTLQANPITVAFSADNTVVTAGTTVQFTSETFGDISSYALDIR